MADRLKTVLVADHRSPTLIDLAKHLACELGDCRIFTARTPDNALDFARTYQPDYIIIVASFVYVLGRPLPDLIRQVSPHTEIIVVADPEQPASASA
jgi:DNA-binding NarL/FixJ family response regulator